MVKMAGEGKMKKFKGCFVTSKTRYLSTTEQAFKYKVFSNYLNFLNWFCQKTDFEIKLVLQKKNISKPFFSVQLFQFSLFIFILPFVLLQFEQRHKT